MPPPHLIFLVVGDRDLQKFIAAGRAVSHQCIVDGLARHGLELDQFGTILDFGCGCGRLTRHWKHLSGSRVFGTDTNRALIEWCQRNLMFAEFQLNTVTPPMNYRDEFFDFIFAGSVFTHMTEDLQFRWLAELNRVLRPGGVLMVTLHGDYYVKHLKPDLASKYARGEHVVVRSRKAGSNQCGAFHPPRYVRERMSMGFELVEHVPMGWDTQDMVILRKSATGAAKAAHFEEGPRVSV